ncbi:MAG: DUF2804 domain-containing protein, partial [Oscillospiraceae bacterium]
GHSSYAGQVTVMLFNFKTGEKIFESSKMLVLPFGSLHLPNSAKTQGDVKYDKNGMYMCFNTSAETRTLTCKCENFEANIVLTRKNPNSLVLTVPFENDPHAFYYNQKINCMTAEGFAKVGEVTYNFNVSDSYGILDWGRGVWPFRHTWYWANGTGMVDGSMFGFNLGCGFGDTSKATENILFYEGKAHKLGRVTFTLGDTFNQPWVIRDDENRLELTLTPTYDRTTKMKLLWVDNCTHQMFGNFRGKAILDDGRELQIDNIISFAEKAVNQW